MNKFSSLSTSVLLALLTSSFTAAAYADGTENLSRVSPRSSHNTSSPNDLNSASTTPNARSNSRKEKEETVSAANSALTAIASNDSPLGANGEPPLFSINGGTPILFAANNTREEPNSFTSEDSTDSANSVAALDAALDRALEIEEEETVSSSAASSRSASAGAGASNSSYDLEELKAQAEEANRELHHQERSSKIVPMISIMDKPMETNSEVEAKLRAHAPALPATPAPNPQPLDATASDLLQSQSDNAGFLGQSTLAMVRTTHELNLAPLDGGTAPAGQAQNLSLSFEHPQDLKESFIVAGDSTVISYGNEHGSFQIVFKLLALDENEAQNMSFDNFKQKLTKRFSDKESLLYGEYNILHAFSSATQALSEISRLKASTQNNTKSDITSLDAWQEQLQAETQSGSPYMDLALRAFLKKSADGILPDMQNFFYERTVLSHKYLATLSCEFRGTQAQAAMIRNEFETFSPLCERIINSYRYRFRDQANQ